MAATASVTAEDIQLLAHFNNPNKRTLMLPRELTRLQALKLIGVGAGGELYLSEKGEQILESHGQIGAQVTARIERAFKEVTEDMALATDSQVDGDHYKKLGQFQPWAVLAEWMTSEELRGFMKGTAIVYLARENDKGKDKDIEKARHTIQLWEQLRKDK